MLRRIVAVNKDKITLVVSHRLSSAKWADKILVLEKGHLQEMGDHCTLIEKQGRYAELFAAQGEEYRA